ncbi:hypothetical protein BHM03_00007658 [Ensete ventricosum]|uniref:Uncharacterized protein n=1 Tax=Ensete ventricosum TaxID=4639 RepID=A0A445MC55_ENSVE|nr:hypothetical protein BHM03_00007658 [Ensete ventricosum]
MVPLGPRLVLRTSWRPLAALMFMWSAADLFSTSAFGFNTRSDILASDRHTVEPKQKRRRRQQRDQARVGF